MQGQDYSIQNYFQSVFKQKNHKIKKRLIYDNSYFGRS